MNLQELLNKRRMAFAEDRLLVTQWCERLVSSYKSLSVDVQEQLPTLPADTPEALLPALFAEPFDIEQYEQQADVLRNIQQHMVAMAEKLNQEALECLSK